MRFGRASGSTRPLRRLARNCWPPARLLQDASTTPFWLDSPVLARLPRSLENFAALMAAAHPTLSPTSVIPYEGDATLYEGDQILLKSLLHRAARHHSMRAREFHCCAVLGRRGVRPRLKRCPMTNS